MNKRVTIVVLALFIVSIWGTIALGAGERTGLPWGNGTEKIKVQTKDKGQSSEDFSIRPNQPVKRLQTLVLFMKSQGLEEEAANYVVTDEQKKLLKKIPEWGKCYVALAVEKGFLTEDELKTFNPNQATKGYELELYKSRLADADATTVENPTDEIVADEDQTQVAEDEEQTVDEQQDASFFSNPMKAIKRFEIVSIINNLFTSVKTLLN